MLRKTLVTDPLRTVPDKRIPSSMKPVKLSLILLFLIIAGGCSTLAGKEDTGVVIARRAQVRSSTAVVAADLKEVVRGDVLEVLDSTTVQDTGERWLRVRTRDAEATEGWIEARNVISQEMVDRSKVLSKEDEGVPAQASGQLRASTNIRFSPDRNGNDNILMKLESGARFDIIGWKRVPRPKSLETTESDDAPKSGASDTSSASKRTRERDENKEPEEVNELWFKVRLPSSISPAPAGWVFGKQVELTVPSDIIFYRTGREFVAWQRLDGEEAEHSRSAPKDKDAAKEVRPGSWVILEKSSTGNTNGLDSPDFDRIYVLGYDKDRQEHYTAYRSHDLEGFLPLRIDRNSDTKIFTVRAHSDGQPKEVRFKAYINERGLLKVEALDELPRNVKAK
ncbi:MAG: hypothetical protein H0T60_15030 [Acidobacteria bacterium]|nr:hypothetical protein [Acidobacteriota bacterium]